MVERKARVSLSPSLHRPLQEFSHLVKVSLRPISRRCVEKNIFIGQHFHVGMPNLEDGKAHDPLTYRLKKHPFVRISCLILGKQQTFTLR